MTAAQLHFHELNSRDIEGTDRVEACATITADQRTTRWIAKLATNLAKKLARIAWFFYQKWPIFWGYL